MDWHQLTQTGFSLCRVHVKFTQNLHSLCKVHKDTWGSVMEYGSIDIYLLTDDYMLMTYVLTCKQLINPAFDLVHWLYVQQFKQFHDMRCAPWWESEGESHQSTFQDDWYAHLQECTNYSETDCEDEFSSDSKVVDSSKSDGVPDLELILDSEDEETKSELEYLEALANHTPSGSRCDHDDGDSPHSVMISVNEPVVSSEDEGKCVKPFLKHEFLLSAVQNAKHPAQQAEPGIHALGQNVACIRGTDWICPKPVVVVVVVVSINGQLCCALIDSGPFSDFMSTTLTDQLKVKLEILDKPLPLQLAVSGSQGKVKVRTTVQFEYQNINEKCTFNIINVNSYDLISDIRKLTKL